MNIQDYLVSILESAQVRCSHVEQDILTRERWDFQRHDMSFDALNLILDGSTTMILDDREYNLQAGDAVFMTSGTRISRTITSESGTLSVLWIIFDATYQGSFRLFSLVHPAKCITSNTGHQMQQLGLQALDKFRDSSVGRFLDVNGLMLQILAAAYKTAESDIAPFNTLEIRDLTTSSPSHTQQEYVRQAISIITAHFRELITLKSLASELCIHPSYFSRLFHKSVGVPPMQFLESTRIREAERLLISTKMPVQDIASAVGYKDPFYFSRVFRRVKGLNPSAFRENVNNVYPLGQ